MEAAKQEIEQTGGVRCLGRQSESRDRGEHKRGTPFQWFTATQRHGNTPSAKSISNHNSAQPCGRPLRSAHFPQIPEKLGERPPDPRSVVAMAKKASKTASQRLRGFLG
jgi:hypothetical protein